MMRSLINAHGVSSRMATSAAFNSNPLASCLANGLGVLCGPPSSYGSSPTWSTTSSSSSSTGRSSLDSELCVDQVRRPTEAHC